MFHVPAIHSKYTCPQCNKAVHGICGVITPQATSPPRDATTCLLCADQPKPESGRRRGLGCAKASDDHETAATAAPTTATNSKWTRKRGPKTGTKRTERTRDSWYSLCAKYRSYPVETRPKIGQFLAGTESGESVSGTMSERVSFGRYLREFDGGTLEPVAAKRRKKSKFILLELKLANYIRLRQQVYHEDNIKLTWVSLQRKLLEWKDSLEDPAYANFSASPGFIAAVVNRHGLGKVNLDASPASVLPQGETLFSPDAGESEEVQDAVRAIAVDLQIPTVSFAEAEAAQQTLLDFATSANMDEEFQRSIEGIGQQICQRKVDGPNSYN